MESVYTVDLKTYCGYVIRHRDKPLWLSPKVNPWTTDAVWVSNPRDAGLWSEDKAQVHIRQNQARVYQPLDKAIREYRINLTAKTGHTPPF